MSRRLLTAGCVLASAVALAVAQPRVAHADGDPSGGGTAGSQFGTSGVTVQGSDITVNSGIQQRSPGSAGGSAVTSTGEACAWSVMANQAALDAGARAGVYPATVGNTTLSNTQTQGPPDGVDPATGIWYTVTCPDTQSIASVWVPNRPGGGPTPRPVSPVVLAQEALAKIHLGPPSIHMSPSANAELVNFSDWLWVDASTWHPVSATASIGGVSATATASPDRVVWQMGDGAEVTCRNPGTPYDNNASPDQQKTDCSYVYPNSSTGQPNNRYTVTATVYWQVTWAAVGAPGGGDLGDIASDTASTPVEVDEVQAVNVSPR